MLRHASELVRAVVHKSDVGLRHQIPDRTRDQHLAGTRFGRNARADVNGETDKLLPAHLIRRSAARPDLQPQRAHGLADRGRAADSCIRARNVASSPYPVVTTSFARSALSSLRAAA